MSTTKRLVEYHIARLKDKRPEVRLDSIRELELLGDSSALEPLRRIYETDDNLDVKKAAQDAGRSIFLKNNKT